MLQEDIDIEGEQSEGQDNGAEDSGDTEDELRRVAEQKEHRPPPGQEENGEDPYAGSTDENTDDEEHQEPPDLPVPELPDFFQGKHFFLYGSSLVMSGGNSSDMSRPSMGSLRTI